MCKLTALFTEQTAVVLGHCRTETENRDAASRALRKYDTCYMGHFRQYLYIMLCFG